MEHSVACSHLLKQPDLSIGLFCWTWCNWLARWLRVNLRSWNDLGWLYHPSLKFVYKYALYFCSYLQSWKPIPTFLWRHHHSVSIAWCDERKAQRLLEHYSEAEIANNSADFIRHDVKISCKVRLHYIGPSMCRRSTLMTRLESGVSMRVPRRYIYLFLSMAWFWLLRVPCPVSPLRARFCLRTTLHLFQMPSVYLALLRTSSSEFESALTTLMVDLFHNGNIQPSSARGSHAKQSKSSWLTQFLFLRLLWSLYKPRVNGDIGRNSETPLEINPIFIIANNPILVRFSSHMHIIGSIGDLASSFLCAGQAWGIVNRVSNPQDSILLRGSTGKQTLNSICLRVHLRLLVGIQKFMILFGSDRKS